MNCAAGPRRKSAAQCALVCRIFRVRVTMIVFFFSSRRRHTRSDRDWSSDVCSSDLASPAPPHEALRCRSCAKFGPPCTIGQLDDVYEIDRYYPMAKPALTLHRLELFLAVLDEGGVGRAAQACHISQPAVSEHLQGLGAHFGVPLLERHGRSVRPTPAARLLEPYARQAVGLLRAAERAAADLQGLRSGALTVGASTTPGTYLLPAVLGRFHAAHPGIVLSLRISDTREIERWVSAGQVEVGGAGGAAPLPRRDEGGGARGEGGAVRPCGRGVAAAAAG